MQPAVGTPERESEAAGFMAELIRLHREVSEIGRQLDRVEVEMRQALHALAWERFEEYR